MNPSANDPARAWAYHPDEPLSGNPHGPLAGLRFSVKDLFAVPGWPLRASSNAPLPAVEESALVRELLALGASCVGKTELHEIGMGITGDTGAHGGTEHHALPGRAPGGSSAGSAVVVARGEVDFALGTDTGGSIRVPAAWSGVCGFKPSKEHPAWPTTGVLPLSPSCDHTGPMARDLDMCIHLHETLSGAAVGEASLQGLAVALWRPAPGLSPEALHTLDAAAEALRAAGARVEAVELPDMLACYQTVSGYEAARVHAHALALPDPGFQPRTLELLRSAQEHTPADYRVALMEREAHRRTLGGLPARFPLLLAPAVPCPPPRLGQRTVELPQGETELRDAVIGLTGPFSMLGVPVVALPRPGYTGLQLVGAWGQDAELLALARAVQRALPNEA